MTTNQIMKECSKFNIYEDSQRLFKKWTFRDCSNIERNTGYIKRAKYLNQKWR